MSTLATPLFFREEEPNEDARLLKLFQNRVELKKEFEKLRTELERLADQLSQQESATLKAQQKLEQIEGLLADPESAANSIVFYQLRNVWQHCRHRLRGFVAELSTTRKQREYQQQIAGYEQQRDADLARIEARLAELDAGSQRLTADIRTVQAARKGLFNLFRRRRLKPKLESLKSSLEAVEYQRSELAEARKNCSAESAPPFEGISVDGKRLINIAVISLAQELYLHFLKYDVSNMAREASIRQVGDVSYGNPRDCRDMSKKIDTSMQALDAEAAELAANVKGRANYLKDRVEFRRDPDTVPVAATLATMPKKVSGNEVVGEVPVNILAEEFWDIFSILLN